MRRPASAVAMPLGQWFCEATGIDDPDLAGTGSSFSAKDKILARAYNLTGNLVDKMEKYNLTLNV
jgi:hypothetical protein